LSPKEQEAKSIIYESVTIGSILQSNVCLILQNQSPNWLLAASELFIYIVYSPLSNHPKVTAL